MDLAEKLKSVAVSLDLGSSSMEEVIGELARLVASSLEKRGIDSDDLRDKLLKRERLLSTAMGCGIAFPHCTSKQLSEPAFALGISRPGIDCDAPDDKPVRIFFVVISPEKDPNSHLEALASASKVFIDPTAREAILSAGDSGEVIAAIAASERNRG